MQRKAGRVPSSGHLSRLKPVEIDPLAEYGLPSKGEKRLLNPKTQETYYAKIAERYLAFCTSAGDASELQKRFSLLCLSSPPGASSSSTTRPNPSPNNPNTESELALLLSALRKLRESLVATSRTDTFASQVYLFSIRLGILTSHLETYHPSLLHLLRVIHPVSNLTSTEYTEVVSYLVLDTACRRDDLSEAYFLRNKYRLREGKVDGVLRALVRGDWVLWGRMRRAVDGYGRKLMEMAEGGVRGHALRAFGRAYLSVGVEYLEKSVFMGWEELKGEYGVGWERCGGRVVIRKVGG
ncbi:hypothetical protein B0T14DRAFT_396066, partial [Immersiella caudata]